MAANHIERGSIVAKTKLILRHPKFFDQLPPVYKWEVTRRHPYYLRFWRWANKYWQWRRNEFDPSGLNLFDRHDFYGSVQVMVFITAIFDRYPDPAIDARLDKQFKSPFSAVLARGETYREMAQYLLTFLPADVRRAVAFTYLRELAKETASDDGLDIFHAVTRTIAGRQRDLLEWALHAIKGDEPLADRLLHGLVELGAASLDKECPGILWVNYNAPLAEVIKQVKSVLLAWKKEHGAADVRRRKDKWDDYLHVWDEREGWSGGAYDGTKSKRLRDIAIESGTDLATVQSRYKAAYKILIGRDYAPLDYLLLFSGLKVTKAKWDSWRRSKHRSHEDAMSASIPASTFQPTGEDGSTQVFMTADDEADYAELVQDLRTLFAKRLTNDQIIAELELDVTLDELEAIRARLTDDL